MWNINLNLRQYKRDKSVSNLIVDRKKIEA